MVERYGEERVTETYSNTSPLRVVWIDRDTLLWKLQEAKFTCLMVDDDLKSRQTLVEELSVET
jgi:hypothetical protein